ncbi:MAG TPA: MobA/MobL family protein [Steroidobacteraceae bacterium]|nr:MobA/MobL family protein [Steroidobacteraceae bacterium]
MAIYYLGMKTFSRSSGKRGSRATSGAAYRAGERIRDERTGAVYDHHRRRDVLHKEIVLPAQLARAGRGMDWAGNRAALWNAAERAELRKNARVAREFVIGLPHELSHEQRTALTRRFAQEIADRYRNAVDLAIHAPRGDARNFHAHLLATTREITADGLGPKTTLELSGTERHRRGLPRWREETSAIRERWATLANEALEKAHVAARVSYWSPEAVRAQQRSRPRLPMAAFRIERRGGRSFIGERIRAQQRMMLERAGRDPSTPATRGPSVGAEAAHTRLTLARTGTNRLGQLWNQTREIWGALRSRFRGREPTQIPARAAEPARETVWQNEGSEGATRELRARQGRERGGVPVLSPDERAQAAARAWLRYREAAQSHGSTLESDRALEQDHTKTREDGRDYDFSL